MGIKFAGKKAGVVRRFAAWGMLGLVVLFALACGVKRPPLPADQMMPDRPEGLEHRFGEGGQLVVTFSRPNRNVLGTNLTDLGGFVVDRSENADRASFCAGCPVRYTQRTRIPAAPPPPGKAFSDQSYGFEDTLRPGYIYHYRIYAHARSGGFAPDRFVSLVVHFGSPPLAPETLEARTEAQLVILTWAPPDRLADGNPLDRLAGYEIQRRPVQGGAWTDLTQGLLWPHPRYEDSSVTNGEMYEYRVRAAREIGGGKVTGDYSRVVSATPRDLTPPPPPVRVDAASVKEGVRLHWPEASASDVAGYRVYRRDQATGQMTKIGPERVVENVFLDRSVRPGGSYDYAVTAVDSTPAANESQPSPVVHIVHEP